ncbi:MAG: NAD(P)-dependent oxidoreductase [Thermoleophilia bacterium]
MRVVIIDGLNVVPDDVARLRAHAEVRVFDDVPATPAEIVARADGAAAILNSWTRIDADVFAHLPALRMVSLAATGTDLIDLEAAARYGVTVCSVPQYASAAVAELTIGLMLAVARHIPAVDREVRRVGAIEWSAPAGVELCGKTLGVVGTGAIGRRVARVARCLGMELVGYDPLPDDALRDELGLRYATLPEVLAASDVVTMHAPLMAKTQGMLGREELRLIPAGGMLINAARARLVDQDALYDALRDGHLAGAGLDDIDLTRPSGRGLLAMENVVVTPHVGYKTSEAVATLAATCAENVVRFLDGDPQNVVAPPAP